MNNAGRGKLLWPARAENPFLLTTNPQSPDQGVAGLLTISVLPDYQFQKNPVALTTVAVADMGGAVLIALVDFRWLGGC